MGVHPNWLERLAGSTRLRILELLLHGDRTVQELATDVGITPNAVRGHLSGMERDGLVVPRGVQRDTGGKPAALYGVSEDADELFPKAYDVILEGLLTVLDERFGPDGVRQVLAEVGARAASEAAGSEEERVGAAAEGLRALGGMVEVHRSDGRWRIQGFACPLSAVARDDRRVCGLVQALVERTTGGSVVEVCDRGRRARCAFEVAFPAGRDSIPTGDSIPADDDSADDDD